MDAVAFGTPTGHEPLAAGDDPAVARMLEFFEAKGLAALKEDDRQETWYADWLEYQTRHHIYASLLSPAKYSTIGARWDLLRYARFIEAFTYCSPAHAYSLHVSLLGLTPILLSSNDALKRDAIAELERGGLFAFGISEKAHGADLLSNEFTVTPTAPGRLVANGSKYYIGNCNAAAMITILARKVSGGGAQSFKRAPLMLFVLRPGTSSGVRNLHKIHTLGIRSAYVGSFDVVDYEFPQTDVAFEGHEAWDATFATINIGKMMLGFGSIGICRHAMDEAVAHLRRRVLFGKPVAGMPHLRRATALAYARFVAMKLYAYRALDYFSAAHAGDRRDLLFNAVQKAKVGSEGVAVVELLSECVGARGFEGETFFETALRDVRLIPALEGSTHINFSAAAAYLRDYLAEPATELPAVPPLAAYPADGLDEQPITTFGSGRPGEVAFANYLRAYMPLAGVANVELFTTMAAAFRDVLLNRMAPWSPRTDLDVSVAVGRCGAVIVYGQLIAERAVLEGTPREVVSVIFHQLLLDLATEVRSLVLLPRCGLLGTDALNAFGKLPATTEEEFAFATLAAEQTAPLPAR